MRTTLDRFGRIVIPKKIRANLGLEAGAAARMSGSERRVAGTRRTLRDARPGDPGAVAAQLGDLARLSIRIHIKRRADSGYRLALADCPTIRDRVHQLAGLGSI